MNIKERNVSTVALSLIIFFYSFWGVISHLKTWSGEPYLERIIVSLVGLSIIILARYQPFFKKNNELFVSLFLQLVLAHFITITLRSQSAGINIFIMYFTGLVAGTMAFLFAINNAKLQKIFFVGTLIQISIFTYFIDPLVMSRLVTGKLFMGLCIGMVLIQRKNDLILKMKKEKNLKEILFNIMPYPIRLIKNDKTIFESKNFPTVEVEFLNDMQDNKIYNNEEIIAGRHHRITKTKMNDFGVIMIQDIEYQKKNERNMVNNERKKAIGEISSELSHEINNKLSVILNTLSIFEMDNLETQETKEMKDTVMDISNTVKKIKMLNSQKSSKEFDINQSLNKLKKLYPSHSFKIKNKKEMLVFAEESMVIQILKNIIENSLSKDATENIVNLVEENNRISLYFKHNGKKLSKDDQEKNFIPFFKTRRGNSNNNFGLKIAQNAISSVNGSFSYEGDSIFKIVLPKKS